MKQAAPEAKVNILLVDDKEENLLAHSEILAELGQNLVLARSGREALRYLLKEDFAVILLDVQMPDLDGFETARLIRQRDRSKYTPIIFLTANSNSDSHAALGYRLGAVDYILKPVSADVLRYKVSFFVELCKKNLEIQRQAQLIRAIEQREYEAKLAQEQLRANEQSLMQELERQRLERRSQELQDANRLKGEFLANMSHEIRTPMNAIIGMAELLVNSELNPDQHEFACTIRESATALLSIINDILDLSKIEAGKLDLNVVNFNLVSLVEGAVELLADKAKEKDLLVTTCISPNLPDNMAADWLRIRQVLINLIGNAIKFTDYGQVSVEAQLAWINDSTLMVRFTVSDTGIGLSEWELSRLFQPFVQADGFTGSKYGGTGLGLSICKRLVQLMGGDIGVSSTPGKGSSFWFTIPCEKVNQDMPAQTLPELEDLKPRRIKDKPGARVLPNNISFVASNLPQTDDLNEQSVDVLDPSKLILVVEDSPTNQRLVLLQLNKLGYVAHVAHNGREAVSEATCRNYSLILMDCQMPEIDGFQATAEIRAVERSTGLRVPIIGLTAQAMEGDRERCLSAGMDDYISKPATLSKLSEVLQRWIPSADNGGSDQLAG